MYVYIFIYLCEENEKKEQKKRKELEEIYLSTYLSIDLLHAYDGGTSLAGVVIFTRPCFFSLSKYTYTHTHTHITHAGLGRNLSGGQRQRLSLARILLSNARILILVITHIHIHTLTLLRIKYSLFHAICYVNTHAYYTYTSFAGLDFVKTHTSTCIEYLIL